MELGVTKKLSRTRQVRLNQLSGKFELKLCLSKEDGAPTLGGRPREFHPL